MRALTLAKGPFFFMSDGELVGFERGESEKKCLSREDHPKKVKKKGRVM